MQTNTTSIKSLQYARVNKRRIKMSLENMLLDPEKDTNKEITKSSEYSEKWTDIVNRDLSLEEILDLEADKEV